MVKLTIIPRDYNARIMEVQFRSLDELFDFVSWSFIDDRENGYNYGYLITEVNVREP